MSALENYSSAYTKGSTTLIIHTTQLAAQITGLLQNPTPSYEAALAIANKCQEITKEGTNWQSEFGPRLSILEILSGNRVPNAQFTWPADVLDHIDKNDAKKRVAVLTSMQQDVANLQAALVSSSRDSIAFEDAIQKSLTSESAKPMS